MKKNVTSFISVPIICQHKKEPLFNNNIYLHNHDAYEIYLFLNGNSTFIIEEKSISLTRGDLLLIPPYTFHGVSVDNTLPYERAFINISSPYFHKLNISSIDLSLCFFSKQEANQIHLSEKEIGKFILIIDELQDSLVSHELAHDIYSNTLLTQLLVLLNRKKTTSVVNTSSCLPSYIIYVMQYINENFTHSFTLDELAKQVHLNSHYLGRQFKLYTGLSYQKYLVSKRIAHAQMLLSSGIAPTEVCFSAGFHDYTNFARTFLNYVGMSPRTYQKSREI